MEEYVLISLVVFYGSLFLMNLGPRVISRKRMTVYAVVIVSEMIAVGCVIVWYITEKWIG